MSEISYQSNNGPSSEALFRRVVKGQGLCQVNSVVDTCNLRWLYTLPIGLYYKALLKGASAPRRGRGGYEGVGRG